MGVFLFSGNSNRPVRTIANPPVPGLKPTLGSLSVSDKFVVAKQPESIRFYGGEDRLARAKPQIQTIITQAPVFDPGNPASVKTYQALLANAQTLARPEVSGRRVGAIAIGGSGTAYLGENIEIKGGMPSDTIHAEAAAFALAKAHGEERVMAMVQTLQPCGSCRQILAEGGDSAMPVNILNPDYQQPESQRVATMTIGALYPMSYSYGTPEKNIFKSPPLNLQKSPAKELSSLDQAAFSAAKTSYLPNPARKTWSGLAAKTKEGQIYTGRALTIAGPNPTITPVQDLLIQMAAAQRDFRDLTEAILVEPEAPDYSFYKNTEALLELVSPGLKLQLERV